MKITYILNWIYFTARLQGSAQFRISDISLRSTDTKININLIIPTENKRVK